VLFWAVTIVNSPRELRGVRLSIGSNAASVWWVNGKEVIGIYGEWQAFRRIIWTSDWSRPLCLFDLGDGLLRFSLHYEADLDRGGASVLDIHCTPYPG